ncbi:MAG: SPOR domain-containing protein [Burkholderiales bacterium]|nr:SPOR domain-containing protein [Burkholderiales bacterium]
MKWLFALLLVANLAFWGYTRLEVPPKPVDWKARQINADKLTVLPIEQPKPAVAMADKPAEPAADSKPATEDADGMKSDSKDAGKAEAKPDAKADNKHDDKAAKEAKNDKPALTCYLWHGVLPDDMPNVRKKIAALGLGGDVKVQTPENEGKVRYWVYIPPRANAADAQKKADELKGLGVSDFFVVNDSSRWQYAVSLGLFASRDAAERRLAAVKDLGVRSAQMHERNDGIVGATLALKHMPKSAKGALTTAANGFRGSSVTEESCD